MVGCRPDGVVSYPPIRVDREAHNHPWHELVLVRRGTYRVRVDDQLHSCGPGGIFLFRAGTIHHPHPEHGCQLTLAQWTGGLTPVLPWVQREDQDHEVATLLGWLWRNLARSGEFARLHNNSLLQTALMSLQDGGSLALDPVSDLARRVMIHINAGSSVEDIAKDAGLSARHLNRVFRDSFGATPAAYRKQVLVNRATQMLLSTDLAVERVADDAGFSNARAMARALHSTYGKTAQQIREQGLGPGGGGQDSD
jgi:AraC-like DNA-binding protein